MPNTLSDYKTRCCLVREDFQVNGLSPEVVVVFTVNCKTIKKRFVGGEKFGRKVMQIVTFLLNSFFFLKRNGSVSL